MRSTQELASRIDAAFASMEAEHRHVQEVETRNYGEWKQRLAKLGVEFDTLREILKPRLDLLIEKLGDKVTTTPKLTQSTRELLLECHSEAVRIRLRFSGTTDHDIRKLILDYDLEIVPILMQFDSHSTLEMPLDAIDYEAAVRWADERIISFIQTYTALHENLNCQRDQIVMDPVTGIALPKPAAGAGSNRAAVLPISSRNRRAESSRQRAPPVPARPGEGQRYEMAPGRLPNQPPCWDLEEYGQRGEKEMDWTAIEGTAFPLGATWIEPASAWNFALYSKDAEGVTLLLYADADLVDPILTYRFDCLRNKSGRIWHCRVSQAAARGARYYAYSVEGPRARAGQNWHRFDPDKVLLDPYAKAVFFPPAFDRAAASHAGSNAGKAPVGLLVGVGTEFDWGDDRRPRHQSDAVIYELHVRGFTNNPNSGVSPQRRGTYAGLIDKIHYLKELGVTAVELMPIFQYDPQEGSCWGYMPLNFFAPHHGYSRRRNEQCDEFREMVKALHAADIEVILDVVYNHTAEGDERGPIHSFKGIDNSGYYLLSDNPDKPYLDFSGTGNTLRCSNPAVRRMIVDSARHWVEEMHIDGFRIDLASALARNDDGSLHWDDPIDLLPPDPLDIRFIAEPWDAAGAYLLGRSFPAKGCLQWNGRFRDDVRRFVRGDPGMVPALMQRIYGSDDLFPDERTHAFHPYQSVNYVTCHDGFTLYDLVSYDRKHNHANGHNNSDGPEENYSWNCGWEGDDGVPASVLELRKRQAKNFCCLMLLANGTPMIRAGDEFLQTQGGNNNPYNQDNTTGWLDWDRLRVNQDVFRFFRSMIAFRKAHPSLCRSRFWRTDVRWYGMGPAVDMGPDSRTLAYYLCGAAQQDIDLYVMINASVSDRTFEIQQGRPDEWQLAFDTGLATPDDFPAPADRNGIQSSSYVVRSHSIVALARKCTKAPTFGSTRGEGGSPSSRKRGRHTQ